MIDRLLAIAIEGATVVAQAQKFKLGQSVEFTVSDLRPKPLGSFKIVRVIPGERGIQQ